MASGRERPQPARVRPRRPRDRRPPGATRHEPARAGAVAADRDRGDHRHLAARVLPAAAAGLHHPRSAAGVGRPRQPGRAADPVAVDVQQHPPRRPGLPHRAGHRHPDRPGPRPEQQAARRLRPHPHRPAGAALGGLGAGGHHLVRPVRRHHLHRRAPRRRPVHRQRPHRRHRPDPADLPARRAGARRQGPPASLAHRPARRLARIPRRTRAGLGLRLAIPHGRRAHRRLTRPRPRPGPDARRRAHPRRHGPRPRLHRHDHGGRHPRGARRLRARPPAHPAQSGTDPL